tara:strand:+ start:213 stop:494 length:282 start_codon:yes stop_codon:yes gene_type:complete
MSNISSFINNKYVITTFIIGLIIWIILIFVGMGYITDKVINDYDVIENKTGEKHEVIKFSKNQERISKMAIIMFWILFVPLSIMAILLLKNKM